MTKISIIMPVYNGEKFLKKSIKSVSKQTLKDIELICVDDGSTDKSLEILEKQQKKHEFIKILTQKNQGSGSARNYGIDEAEGEYIAFIDADDIFVDPDALEKMYELANLHDADMVCANLKELLPNGDLIYNSNYTKNNYYEFKKTEKIPPKDYGVPWAFYKNIYKKTFLDENNIRFKDLIRGQDPVFLAEVLVNVSEIYGIPKVLYAYLFPVKGKPYLKVNTYKKKLHYITHYKMTFDIFEKNGLKSLSEKYKPKFLNYAKYTANDNDTEAYEIITDIFNESYFTNYTNRYMYFKISHILNKINIENTQEYFTQAKNELLKYDIWMNKRITAAQHRTISYIMSCETFEEYKKDFSKINTINLKEKHKQLKEKYKILNKQHKDNTRKNNNLKKLQKSLLNSSSWKITGFLRKN